MRQVLNNIYTWGIGERISKNKYLVRKAKILINAHLIALIMLLPSIFTALYLEFVVGLVFILVFVAISSSFLAFRYWQSFLISGNSFVLICMLSTLFMIYNFGGYQSTYMVWLFMIPVYSFVIANRRSAFFWFVLTVATILFILFFFPTSVNVSLSATQLKGIAGVNMVAFFIFIFAMEYLSSETRRTLIGELEFEKQQHKAILSKVPAGLAYIDKDLRVVYYNPVLARFFKLDKQGAEGMFIKDIIGEYYYNYNLPYYLRALEGETVVYERYVGPKENPIFIRCIYVPRFNKKGEVIGFINLISDLTKMKEAEKIKLETKEKQKSVLNDKLHFRNRELASQELFITNQKKLLEGIKQSLFSITDGMDTKPKNAIRKIIRTIDQNINLEDEWDNFKIQFERIHPDFIDRLQLKYPRLNARELRHCSYLRMRLANKEIARIQNLSLKSVEMTNYRLKKKLKLDQKVTLSEYIAGF